MCRDREAMYRYWGKARKREDGKWCEYYLVVWHVFDVAAAGRENSIR